MIEGADRRPGPSASRWRARVSGGVRCRPLPSSRLRPLHPSCGGSRESQFQKTHPNEEKISPFEIGTDL